MTALQSEWWWLLLRCKMGVRHLVWGHGEQSTLRPGFNPRDSKIPEKYASEEWIFGNWGFKSAWLPSWLSNRVGLVVEACCTSLLAGAWGASLKPLVSLTASSHGTVPRLPSAGCPHLLLWEEAWLMMSSEFLGLEMCSAKLLKSNGGEWGREGPPLSEKEKYCYWKITCERKVPK